MCSEHYETDNKESEGDKTKKDDKKESASSANSKDTKSGNVEKKADEKKSESDAKDGSHQGMAVLGIAAIAMGEDIGIDMAIRAFNHLVSAHVGYQISSSWTPFCVWVCFNVGQFQTM